MQYGRAERLPTISIHALRKESDLALMCVLIAALTFQSTLSVRRATAEAAQSAGHVEISIHALRKESDPARKESSRPLRFQSTLSVRRATENVGKPRKTHHISIHALRKESDTFFIML